MTSQEVRSIQRQLQRFQNVATVLANQDNTHAVEMTLLAEIIETGLPPIIDRLEEHANSLRKSEEVVSKEKKGGAK